MSNAEEFCKRSKEFRSRSAKAKKTLLDSMSEPHKTQNFVLEDLRKITEKSVYWYHQNADLSTLRNFRESVPISQYANFEDQLIRETLTKGGIFSTSPIARWLKTSGTTGKPKLIPYTHHWMAHYRVPAMYAMWDTYLESCPQILLHEHATLDTQSIRENVEPSVHGLPHQAISNRHPIIDICDWNPPWYNAPWYGPNIPSTHSGRMYHRIRYFLGQDLRALTAINPSMILSMHDHIYEHADELFFDLKNGTLHGEPVDIAPLPREADRLKTVITQKDFTLADIWPRLNFYSCWTAGSSRHYLPLIEKLFSNAKLVPFMTCGTEGVITIPISPEDHAQPLAINQALFEFIPISRRPEE